jgi:hypothetical protein
LAVPAQALQAFGFHLVGDIFCAAHFGFGHGGWCGWWGVGDGAI